MSKQTEKPAWASKIIHMLNCNQRDLIALQRSQVRTEATIMAVNETMNDLLARSRNANGHQTLANDRRINYPSNGMREQNHNRAIQNLVNRPNPNRPHYSNVHYSRNQANTQEQNAGPSRSAARCIPATQRQNHMPPTPPPIAPVAAAAEELSMEMEENLLNLSDSE